MRLANLQSVPWLASLAAGAVLCLTVAGAGAQGSQTSQPGGRPATPAAQTHQQAAESAQEQSKAKVKTNTTQAPVQAPAPTAGGVLVDRLIAVVNGQPVLESDVREEERFEAFEPFSVGNHPTRDDIIERLINRTLILQQASLQQSDPVTDAAAETEIEELRKQLPACKEAHCETEAGWQGFLKAHGFTSAELLARWKQRMEVLNYIELRFRAGILITPTQISTYYKETMLPEYAKRNAKAPPLESISSRIQEVLLQQQVTSLLEDWLKSLKAEGSVRILKPDEVNG